MPIVILFQGVVKDSLERSELRSFRLESRVSHELSRLQCAALNGLHEHRRRHGIDKPRRQSSVSVPEFLQMQRHRPAMIPYIRQVASGRENPLTDIEGHGHSHSFDRNIHTFQNVQISSADS
jgi:hypothetical protein